MDELHKDKGVKLQIRVKTALDSCDFGKSRWPNFGLYLRTGLFIFDSDLKSGEVRPPCFTK